MHLKRLHMMLDENAEENEIINKDKVKVVTIKEYKKILEYQETVNLDIEKISSTSKKNCISIYEVIYAYYFKVVKLFPSKLLNQCKINQNDPQNTPNEVKAGLKTMALGNGLYAQVVMIFKRELYDNKDKDMTKKLPRKIIKNKKLV